MDQNKNNKFKTLWKNCPNRKSIRIWIILLAIYMIYRLGYIIGVFLANIGF